MWKISCPFFTAIIISGLAFFYAYSGHANGLHSNTFIVDNTGTLSQDEVRSLNESLSNLHHTRVAHFAVQIIESTFGEPIDSYSLRTAKSWRLGTKGIDEGLLLVVALKDRRYRLEVGYGLEHKIPDVIAHRFLEEQLRPELVRGSLYKGLVKTIGEVHRLTDARNTKWERLKILSRLITLTLVLASSLIASRCLPQHLALRYVTFGTLAFSLALHSLVPALLFSVSAFLFTMLLSMPTKRRRHIGYNQSEGILGLDDSSSDAGGGFGGGGASGNW